ncbi:hypothetical protein [Frisingicoccus sp.]|uniref:hypothetical protein n=1 Tax=Frisingicoccus sp. TaxID=1918627 RepID=UPI003AB61BBE
MENKKLKTLSLVSLIISVIPVATLIPMFLKITLPEGVSTALAGVNIASAVVGLILSIVCVRSEESRSPVNIASTIVSAFWCLLMIGMLALALFLTFLQ